MTVRVLPAVTGDHTARRGGVTCNGNRVPILRHIPGEGAVVQNRPGNVVYPSRQDAPDVVYCLAASGILVRNRERDGQAPMPMVPLFISQVLDTFTPPLYCFPGTSMQYPPSLIVSAPTSKCYLRFFRPFQRQRVGSICIVDSVIFVARGNIPQ